MGSGDLPLDGIRIAGVVRGCVRDAVEVLPSTAAVVPVVVEPV